MASNDEAAITRIMPQDSNAEQAVVGAMIMDREAIAIASDIITDDDFYGKQYGTVFAALVELNNDGKPVDVVTLQDKLREKGVSSTINSTEFIMSLVNAVPTSANVKHYADIVAKKALLRRMIRVNEDIANKCYADQEAVEDILVEAEKKVYDVVQQRATEDIKPIRESVMEVLDAIGVASRTKGNVTGLETGFLDLDYMTAGLHPAELILIAARPAMGKTAFVLNIAEHIAFRLKECVAIFSLEMPREQLIQRLIALESKVDSQHIRTGELSEAEWEKVIESANTIAESKLLLDDSSNLTIGDLQSKCRKYKMDHDLKLIIIDYLQLMSGNGKNSNDRQREITEISRSLKILARELNVPVIALSQLSRKVEERPDHRPMLSDLRESGAIEQDADIVMFIYRDDYYNKDSDRKGIADIIIAKQRGGSIGDVSLVWMEQYTKFANMEHRSKNTRE